MEEYLAIPKQHQQLINSSFDSNLELLPKLNKNPNQHRHISLIYGLQFQSKVTLFARQQSQSATLTDFQNITKEEMYKKVLTFLNLVVTDSSIFEEFIKPFKILDQQMHLSIKKSRSSIYSNSGQINLSSASDCSSKNKIKQVFTQLTNLYSPRQIEEQGPSKTRAEMMSKTNRVSLAQAISISQLHKFANLQAIKSAQSLQSFQSSLKEFKSKRRLSSEQSDNKGDCRSIPQTITLINKPSERKNKISITLMDELSVSSQLFSQGQTGLSLSDIKLTELKVDQVMLEVFFDPPSPYLINLSLCLFCKCLSRGLVSLKEDSIGWLLGISTIVAYKLYYDEPIEGLFQWFCEGMSMNLPDLIKLQRWFLGSLKYEAAVSTRQYQNMLMRLMTIS